MTASLSTGTRCVHSMLSNSRKIDSSMVLIAERRSMKAEPKVILRTLKKLRGSNLCGGYPFACETNIEARKFNV